MIPTKQQLLEDGAKLVSRFCEKNKLPTPIDLVIWEPSKWRFPHTCAYYRPDEGINICVAKCAHPGTAGRAWSWPGYMVDRTPYGVLAHELGHHIDWLKGSKKGSYWSDFGESVRRVSGEAPLSGYCPNDAEWFAEMMRLFITNSDLLRQTRPRTYSELRLLGLKPLSIRDWIWALKDAPERTLAAAQKKVELAQKRRG